MKKILKKASLGRLGVRELSGDMQDPESSDLSKYRMVDVALPHEGKEDSAQTGHVVLAQAETEFASDAGSGAAATPAGAAATSAAASSGATAAGAASAPVAAATSASLVGGFSAVTYGIAAVGVGVVAIAAGKSKSSSSSSPATPSVSDTADNLAPGGVANTTLIASGMNVTVTTPATLAQLAAIDSANGSGSVSCAAVKDTLANLVANTGGYVQATTNVTIADSAANLLNAATVAESDMIARAVALNVSGATVADVAALQALNATATLTYGVSDTSTLLLAELANVASTLLSSASSVVVVVDSNPLSVADALALLGSNASVSMGSYSISDTAANLLQSNATSMLAGAVVTGGLTAAIFMQDSPTNLTAAQAKTLRGLNASLDLSQGYGIADNSTNLLAAVNAGGADAVAVSGAAWGVVVSDAPALSLANAVALLSSNTSSSAVTMTYSITDTAAALLGTLTAQQTSALSNATSVAVTSASNLTLAEYDALQVLNPSVTYSGGYSISDSVANLLPGHAALAGANGVAVTGTPVLSAADATVLNGLNASVTMTFSLSDTAANLLLISPAVAAAATGIAVSDATVGNPLVTTVADAVALDGLNASVTMSYHISDTATNLATGLTTALPVMQAAGVIDIAGGALVVNGTSAQTTNLGTLMAFNGDGTLTLGGGNNAAYTVNLGLSGVTSVILDGTGTHNVTGSNAVAETFVLQGSGGAALVAGTGGGDTIQLSAGYANLNLAQFGGSGIEKIDLSVDAGVNSVTLTAADVFLLGSNLVDAADGTTPTLVINGNGSDVANIVAAGFALQGAQNAFDATGAAGAGYDKYTATYTDAQSVAHLVEVLLQSGVVAA